MAIFSVRHKFDVTATSMDDLTDKKAKTKTKRPTSPHVSIYKFPYAALASITNRVCGVTLSMGFLALGALSFPGLPVSLLPSVVNGIQAMPALYMPLKSVTVFALGYHTVKSVLIINIPGNVQVTDVNRIGTIAFGVAGVL